MTEDEFVAAILLLGATQRGTLFAMPDHTLVRVNAPVQGGAPSTDVPRCRVQLPFGYWNGVSFDEAWRHLTDDKT